MSTPTIVYTDGACQGNPGPGGWAWAVPDGAFCSGAEAATTNQRMELTAALEAVTALRGPVQVVSDSTYVVNCFKNRWWEGWLRKGWKNSQRQPVANRDLWEPLIDEYRADMERLEFRWVKGHSGDRMNDLVDRLAVEAAARQEGRSGSEPPEDLGAPDRPGAGRRPAPSGAGEGRIPAAGGSASPAGGNASPSGDNAGASGDNAGAAPVGHRVLVTGLRPDALGGYDDNLTTEAVRRQLAEILGAKAVLHPDLLVTTGLGLGSEQLAAEAAAEARVPYVAVLAFADQDRMWPAASRARFASLMEGATETRVLDRQPPGDRQSAGRALGRRDEWLAANADEAVVVWDEQEAAVGRTVRSLQRRLGEEQVWIVRP